MGRGCSPSQRVGLSISWYVDSEQVSRRVITTTGYEALARILAGQWKLLGWVIRVGSDATPEDITDDQVYEPQLDLEPGVTVEIGEDYSRIIIAATASANQLTGVTVGELGLVAKIEDETGTQREILVDRTAYGPATFGEDKTFTCVIELHRW